jgi:hypothetical protein
VVDREARAKLAEVAAADASEVVRARALQSLSQAPQTDGSLELCREILQGEKSIGVVKEALRNLSLLASSDPEALAELKRFAARCAHPDLCAYIDGLVQASDSGAWWNCEGRRLLDPLQQRLLEVGLEVNMGKSGLVYLGTYN